MMLLRIVLGACTLIGVISFTAACGGEAAVPASPNPSPAVLATVDGLPVTAAEVAAISAEWRLTGQEGDAVAARDEALRRLLVRRRAQELGLEVAVASLARRLEALEERLGGEDAFSAALSAADMTPSQMEEVTRYSLLEAAAQDRMFADLAVGGAAVRGFYERHLGDLFTRPPSDRLRVITVPTKATADRLAREVADGASFAVLARRSSLDPETRDQGGSLGWVTVASLPGVVREVVADTRVGRVSEPVRFYGRWHIYLVESRRRATPVPFEDVEDDIRDELTRRKRAVALARWTDRARERADIVLP